MLKKEEVFVRVSSEKKARKLAKLLDMFGEGVYKPTLKRLKNGVVSDEYPIVHYNWEWNGIVSSPIDKTNVSLKELRNILAVEHLKEGDVIVASIGSIKYIVKFERFVKKQIEGCYIYESIGGAKLTKETGYFDKFISYATEEEKALLEPKKELEVGKWYRHTSGSLANYQGLNKSCYGISIYGGWNHQEWFITRNQGWTEAPAQEVEEALIKEAKRRYKVGDKLNKVQDDFSKGNRIFNTNLTHQAGLCDLWIDDDNRYSSCIFKDGKWAKVIKEHKSLEERVKELEDRVKELESR